MSGNSNEAGSIQVDVLIIGTGPAGASLASFLSRYDGLSVMAVNRFGHTANSPRAHITNIPAMECFRDIGLETECIEQGSSQQYLLNTRWTHTVLGEEYCRVWAWGNDPARKSDYELVSPCKLLDLPQMYMEPILIKDACLHGVKIRFDTEFIRFEQKADHVETVLRDRINDYEYTVNSKYLVGADGGNSKVVSQLGIPFNIEPHGPLALNIIFEMDLTKYMDSRNGVLHWVLNDQGRWGWLTVLRMVRPWTEWMLVTFATPEMRKSFNPTEKDYLDYIRNSIGGNPDIPIKFKGVSKWQVNETFALQYQVGRVFGIGDAVHRHPPMNGLGSNTCVQDSFNLAWKMAYVLKGFANESLLETYNAERQPIGGELVTDSNNTLRAHAHVWDALMGHPHPTPPDPEKAAKALKELSESTPAGIERRKRLREAIQNVKLEFHGLGREMNHVYSSSAVINDESVPIQVVEKDSLYHRPSTYPGHRLPHVWLSRRISDEPLISTIDLVGKGEFTILTGIGGEAWKDAAEVVSKSLAVPIKAYSIGIGQDYQDTYFDWDRLSEIQENGCIVVRPDRFIAWRCKAMVNDPEERLTRIMMEIVGKVSK